MCHGTSGMDHTTPKLQKQATLQPAEEISELRADPLPQVALKAELVKAHNRLLRGLYNLSQGLFGNTSERSLSQLEGIHTSDISVILSHAEGNGVKKIMGKDSFTKQAGACLWETLYNLLCRQADLVRTPNSITKSCVQL